MNIYKKHMEIQIKADLVILKQQCFQVFVPWHWELSDCTQKIGRCSLPLLMSGLSSTAIDIQMTGPV